jgi:hypothetical protein
MPNTGGQDEGSLNKNQSKKCKTMWNKIVNNIGSHPAPLLLLLEHASPQPPPRLEPLRRAAAAQQQTLLTVGGAPQTLGHQRGEEPSQRMGKLPQEGHMAQDQRRRWVPPVSLCCRTLSLCPVPTFSTMPSAISATIVSERLVSLEVVREGPRPHQRARWKPTPHPRQIRRR